MVSHLNVIYDIYKNCVVHKTTTCLNFRINWSSEEEEPKMSASRRSQQVGLSDITTWLILRKYLALNVCEV